MDYRAAAKYLPSSSHSPRRECSDLIIINGVMVFTCNPPQGVRAERAKKDVV